MKTKRLITGMMIFMALSFLIQINGEAIALEEKSGWPVATGVLREGFDGPPPTVADLNHDGRLEVVVVGADGKLRVLKYDGTLLSEWNNFLADTKIIVTTPPVLGDLNADGFLDIVVGGWEDVGWPVSDENRIYALSGRDGTTLTGWPVTTANYGSGNGRINVSPVIVDLDKDGDLEIIAAGPSEDWQFYAFHHDGSNVSGWPVYIWELGYIENAPAVADINYDTYPEIIVGANTWGRNNLLILNQNGTVNRKIENIKTKGAISLGDLDDDRDLELVFFSGTKVCVYNQDGSVVNGWPQDVANYLPPPQGCQVPILVGSPILSDLNNDGKLEVIAVGGLAEIDCSPQETGIYLNIWVWRENGQFFLDGAVGRVPHWANGPKIFDCLSAADLDNDGNLEILIKGRVEFLRDGVYAFKLDKNLLTNFPLSLPPDHSYTVPTIGDLDENGKLEILINTDDGKIHCWELPFQKGNSLHWPMFRHDPQHTGAILRLNSLTLPAGWNQISLGGTPITTEPRIVFKDNSGNPIPLYLRLYRYDSTLRGYIAYQDSDPVQFGSCKRGEGYWLHLDNPTTVSFLGFTTPGTVEIPLLTSGWHMIGSVSNEIYVANLKVLYQGNAFTWEQALNQNLMEPVMYHWDPLLRSYIAVDASDSQSSEHTVTPWHGYWINVQQPNLTLVIPSSNPAGIPMPIRGDLTDIVPPSSPIDTTPPTKPIVTDEGQVTTRRDRLSASWVSNDPESAIIDNLFCITQDVALASTYYMVQPWKSTGTASSVTATGLKLKSGKRYYFGVKTKNGAGLESTVGHSDGITVE